MDDISKKNIALLFIKKYCPGPHSQTNLDKIRHHCQILPKFVKYTICPTLTNAHYFFLIYNFYKWQEAP